MPSVMFEIRVTKITVPLSGPLTQETLYLAKPVTAPDPGAVIASCNPALVLPRPPPIVLDGQIALEISGTAAMP
jgi:hypothetical protein